MVEEYGVFGLFVLAFLAATILPFSSEVAVVSALYGGMSSTTVLVAASLGNVSAILLNYTLGHWLRERYDSKLRSSKMGRKALHFSKKYSIWALLLTPFPVIGDPITLAAGVVRLKLLPFILIAGGLRISRYALVVYLFQFGRS